jgi:uncharacterized repeat protein (TIGR03943 family)
VTVLKKIPIAVWLNIWLNNWLNVIAIAVWGLLLIKLWLFGQLYLLIHPNYVALTVTTGFALLVVSALETWQIINRKSLNNFRHTNFLPTHWSAGLLLVTAVLGLLISPRPFASETAIHRGVTDSLTATRALPKSFRASNRPEERSLIEWIRTLNVYPEPDAYVGQKVKVQGFTIHPRDLPDQMFLIARFVITCCAADVYPISLPVKLTQSRSAYPPDRWLEIEGTMITETINGKRQLTIQPQTLTPIAEPKNPYDT